MRNRVGESLAVLDGIGDLPQHLGSRMLLDVVGIVAHSLLFKRMLQLFWPQAEMENEMKCM